MLMYIRRHGILESSEHSSLNIYVQTRERIHTGAEFLTLYKAAASAYSSERAVEPSKAALVASGDASGTAPPSATCMRGPSAAELSTSVVWPVDIAPDWLCTACPAALSAGRVPRSTTLSPLPSVASFATLLLMLQSAQVPYHCVTMSRAMAIQRTAEKARSRVVSW